MKALIVGDLENYAGIIKIISAKLQVTCKKVSNIQAAIKILCQEQSFDVLFLDMVEHHKAETHQLLASNKIFLNIIVVHTREQAFSLHTKNQTILAVDYLSLPPDKQLLQTIYELVFTLDKNLIAKSSIMQPLLVQVKTHYQTHQSTKIKAPIFITGEPGTGKDLLARYICDQHDYVRINCAKMPLDYLDSEFFGHKENEYGALCLARIGKLQEALKQHKILIVEEVFSLSLALQEQLFLLLENTKFPDQIIMTNCVLTPQQAQGPNIHPALYHKLNQHSFYIPPLRMRQADITKFAKYFNQRYCQLYQVEEMLFTEKVIKMLLKYQWPGNVRELKMIIAKAVCHSNNGYIDIDDIFFQIQDTINVSDDFQVLGLKTRNLQQSLEAYLETIKCEILT